MIKTIENSNGIVRFAFKESIRQLENDKKKDSLIFLHFSYGGNRFKYSTGYKSCFMDWDFDKQRIKQTKSNIINAIEVNEFLSKIENVVKKEYSRLIAEQIIINNDVLKRFLDIYLNKNVIIDNSIPKTFFEFCEEILNQKAKDISIITKRSYKQTLLKVKNYGIDNNEKINFNSFDKGFVLNFIDYLQEKDFSQNTISKHLKNLKTFLIEANQKRLIKNLDFNIKDFSVTPEETTAIYLSTDELKKMLDLDLSEKKHYELARDVFLIGCYTGQRVSDYNGLTSSSIKIINDKEYFSIKQKKTGAKVNCYITKEIKQIMNLRYNGLPPRKILEKDLNKYIKIIGGMLKFNEKIECIFKKGGKEIREYIPKYKLIHSHTARRSFCTNMYKNKMPVFDIMLFSGHKSEKEFYKYIRIAGEERASHIVSKGFFD
ncbi:MAG: site-specific integrase [Flavobacterium sp.]|uniref:site-specific integrase n=1 Tax=Flavobacterium sp. TaxID=239 RepID=UPI00260F96D6|nr:site-specific integrase [Flavobacterium sp.]MDD5149857.1 site-specific integrase [Flavobacterium sp.]